MNDISSLIWVKKYLNSRDDTSFFEVRNWKNYALVNRRDPNIAGYHLSDGSFDCANEMKTVYEYIERIVCKDTSHADITMCGEGDKGVLSFEQLGFGWTGLEFRSLGKKNRYVGGISLRTGEKFFIPTVAAYYFDNDFTEWSDFAGNSNGNALGDTQEDAIDRGLAEFIERDKFVKYWYLQNGELLRVAPELFNSKLKGKIKYFYRKGYQVDFFTIHNQPETIYTIWCLFRSVDRKNKLFSFTGLGADCDFEKAAEKAFDEASATVFFHMSKESLLYMKERNTVLTEENPLQEGVVYYFSYDREKEFERLFEQVDQINAIPQMGCSRETLREKALNYYRDIIYVPIQNKLLEELGMYEVKVFGIGGNNMYFTSREEILKKGKITGPCPLA